MNNNRTVYTFEDYKCTPDPVFALERECLEPCPAPVVVDNGSFQCRAGWASVGPARCDSPRLVFRAAAARVRGAARSDAHVGNDIASVEPLRWSLKSAFDRDAVVNFDIQELIFDYIFMHLGINTQGRVDHPVVVTEPACNPLHCRQMMSELLFEGYGVPRVAYGVDSLFSLYWNSAAADLPSTGLVLSSGHHCSHVLPVINGRLDSANCRRVNLGGGQAASYLQRLLQLKYPSHQPSLTLSRMEELLHRHCYTAPDYQQELDNWRSPEFYEREVHRVQLPFSGRTAGVCVSAEERNERRAQQLRRLQEINSRRREEKLQEDQRRLDTLLSVQELLEDGALELFHRSLVELNMDSAEELQSYIQKLSMSVEQQRLIKPEMPSPTAEVEPPADEGNDIETDLSEETQEPSKTSANQPLFSVAEYHQLFVGTERLRAPEILFQPALVGEEQMGLMETLQFVLEQYPPEQQEALVKNVFLTGGNLQYPGLKERVQRELLAIRPFQSHFQVCVASRPALDAWFGAREWALRNPAEDQGWISRQDYEENGGEYLREHCASNTFIPMKLNKPTSAAKHTLMGKLATDSSLPDTISNDIDISLS
ncbi:actin-related protein 5 [Pimephales promelas]|uniref:actin-related protein 5 n=1 Tax=Pimephales promelas TaxID=90988 RepID=UPI001955A085|nr:actin-related protein 5 [Pimephales promelas]KAG1929070.1 actin-related protein [Pimephales promelas]